MKRAAWIDGVHVASLRPAPWTWAGCECRAPRRVFDGWDIRDGAKWHIVIDDGEGRGENGKKRRPVAGG